MVFSNSGRKYGESDFVIQKILGHKFQILHRQLIFSGMQIFKNQALAAFRYSSIFTAAFSDAPGFPIRAATSS